MYSIAVIQWDFSLGGRNAMLRAYSLNGRTLSPFVALAAGRFTGVVETVFLWGSFTLYVIILLINTCVCVRSSRLYRVLLLHSNARLSACQPAPLLPSPPPCVYNSYSSPPSLFCIAHSSSPLASLSDALLRLSAGSFSCTSSTKTKALRRGHIASLKSAYAKQRGWSAGRSSGMWCSRPLRAPRSECEMKAQRLGNRKQRQRRSRQAPRLHRRMRRRKRGGA